MHNILDKFQQQQKKPQTGDSPQGAKVGMASRLERMLPKKYGRLMPMASSPMLKPPLSPGEHLLMQIYNE